jgi:hypothetical protein
MEQIVQVIGALVILTAFALSQWRVLNADSLSYLSANFVGAGVLAVDAYVGSQWGFLLLEGAWAVISAVGLVQWLRRQAGRV